jgi:hypothetical protein
MFGLGNVLGSFGTIPDILMGKDPKKALADNLKAAAVVGTGMMVGPSISSSFSSPAIGGSVQGLGMPGAAAGHAGQGLLSQGLDMVGQYAGTAKNVLGAVNSAKGLLAPSPLASQQLPPSSQSVGAATGGLLAYHDARQQDQLRANAERRRALLSYGQQFTNQFQPYGGATNVWPTR